MPWTKRHRPDTGSDPVARHPARRAATSAPARRPRSGRGCARARSSWRARVRVETLAARSRARGGGGRSGGSRPRPGLHTSGLRGVPALRRLSYDLGKLGQPLDELTLLVRRLTRNLRRDLRLSRVPEDSGNARVRVLDVVDGVLLAALLGEVDVDVDRLFMSARNEVPAGRVHPDLLDQFPEEHDVATSLRRLPRLAALEDVHELVDQDLELVGVIAEHRGRGFEPRDVPVMVG